MPRIPNESLDPKNLPPSSSLDPTLPKRHQKDKDKFLYEPILIDKKVGLSKKKILDIWMGLVIFLSSFIEIISFFKPDDNNPAIITDTGDNYLLFWFPLFASLELFIFSLFFVFKAFRYSSCLSTKIISILFSFVQMISILSLVITLPVMIYITFTQPIILSIVILLISINFIKWFSK